MECPRDMEFTHGMTKVVTKEILNKDSEMAMEFGRAIQKLTKYMKVIIC